jgi:hypothetical protein
MYFISRCQIVSLVFQPEAPGADRDAIPKVAAEDTILNAKDVEEGNM